MKNNLIISEEELEYLLIKEEVLKEFYIQDKTVPDDEELEYLIDSVIWSTSCDRSESFVKLTAKYVVELVQ